MEVNGSYQKHPDRNRRLSTNDNMLPFEGDPYEHVMINIVKALNAAAMGQLTEAVVEARQDRSSLERVGGQCEKKKMGIAKMPLPGISLACCTSRPAT